jgi:hypothetical protein
MVCPNEDSGFEVSELDGDDADAAWERANAAFANTEPMPLEPEPEKEVDLEDLIEVDFWAETNIAPLT